MQKLYDVTMIQNTHHIENMDSFSSFSNLGDKCHNYHRAHLHQMSQRNAKCIYQANNAHIFICNLD